jgi:hypothetical protein
MMAVPHGSDFLQGSGKMLRNFIKYAGSGPVQVSPSNINVSRASQEPNPLELYNLTSMRTAQNNIPVTHPLKSTVTHVLGFSLKKASDTIQCPHKIYRCFMSAIQPPTNIGSDSLTSFVEEITQSELDKIKIQDSTPYTKSSTSTNAYAQMLVEFDLSVIANQYGWDNATLKSKLKKLTVEAYASGSGANAGATAYGVNLQIWNGGAYTGYPSYPANNTSTIAKMLWLNNDATSFGVRVNSSNKLYVLINATYPSDGTIASTVNLDFIRLLVDVDASAQADYTFIGGDTQTLTFDFGTKVANSVVECPMNIIRGEYTSTPPNPFIGTSVDIQTDIDKIKSQDSAPYMTAGLVNGYTRYLMVEIDLTPLCNARFGGSNAALKAALKQIAVDVWARGSGANASALTYGVVSKLWSTSVWGATEGVSQKTGTSSSVEKLSFTVANDPSKITTSNKLYILIASQYASNGTIPSTVDLDFIQVRVDIARTPDVVTPVPVVLPNKWSIIGEFSPNWGSTITATNKRIFVFYKDANNWLTFRWDGAGKFVSSISGDALADLATSVQTFSKGTTYKFLLSYDGTNRTLYILKNNGTVEKIIKNKGIAQGVYNLYPLSTNTVGYDADSFFRFIKLLKNWVPKDDGVAELTLRGLYPDANQELVVNGDFSQGSSGWTMATNSVVTAGELVITVADATLKQNYQKINVLPNTKYKLTVGKNTGRVSVTCYTKTDTYITNVSLLTNQTGEVLYTTPASCAWINIICDNFIGGVATSGTFTFDNISFKFANENAPSGFDMPNLVPLFSDARWKLSVETSPSVDGKILTLNATITYRKSYVDISILPNNKYSVSCIKGLGYLAIDEYYNNTMLKQDACKLVANTDTSSWITGANTNKIRITLYNTTTGTFTFSNLSLKLLM